MILEIWWEPNANGDPSKASVKRCRFCGGSKNLHSANCRIGGLLIEATSAGLGKVD
jgi:hypothetical protein